MSLESNFRIFELSPAFLSNDLLTDAAYPVFPRGFQFFMWDVAPFIPNFFFTLTELKHFL